MGKKDVCLCVNHQPMTTSQNLTWDIMFKRQKHTLKPPWPLTTQISYSVNLSEHLYHLKGFSRGFFQITHWWSKKICLWPWPPNSSPVILESRLNVCARSKEVFLIYIMFTRTWGHRSPSSQTEHLQHILRNSLLSYRELWMNGQTYVGQTSWKHCTSGCFRGKA